MAETKPLRNTLSKRFSTTRPLAFRGGSTVGGNLQPPTAGQVAGVNPPSPSATASSPGISSFYADTPRPSGMGPAGAVGLVAGGQLLSAAAKKGIDTLWPSKDKSATTDRTTQDATAAAAVSPDFNDTVSPLAGAVERSGGGFSYPGPAQVETFPYVGAPPVTGTPLPDASGVTVTPYNAPPDVIGTPLSDAGGSEGFAAGPYENGQMYAAGPTDTMTDVGGWGGEAPVAPSEGFAAGSEEALQAAGEWGLGDVLPYAPAVLNLIRGNVRGAAGSAIGATVGNMIFPGVGGFVGGFLGSRCFITEAVMAAGGQGDAAPELEILRWFRDNVMARNPVGQSMVQQYYAIAPMVVEAVSQRPDGVQIFQGIKAQFIDPAVQAIQQGDNEQALQIYAKMIAYVTPFAIEAVMGPGGEPSDRPSADQAELDQFGTDATIVANSPEVAAAATGGDMMGDMMGGGPAGPQMAMMGGAQPGMMGGQPGGQDMMGGMMQNMGMMNDQLPTPKGPPAITQFHRRRY